MESTTYENSELAAEGVVTVDQARRLLASVVPNGFTLHRRPRRGSIPCWGKCGRMIAANKAHCLECSKLVAATAEREHEGLPLTAAADATLSS